MKPTGIIRRIDDLGRVVIPKELRRTLGLAEGDPMEIFTEGGCVIFRRYQCSEDIQGAATVVERLLQNNEERLKNSEAIIEAFQAFQDALNEEG